MELFADSKNRNIKRLDKKVAIVTGGATGIGEAISMRFAMEGTKVLVVGMQQAQAKTQNGRSY